MRNYKIKGPFHTYEMSEEGRLAVWGVESESSLNSGGFGAGYGDLVCAVERFASEGWRGR